ncbi:putative 2-dehydropantoate 2-reductase [compost metagenome]
MNSTEAEDKLINELRKAGFISDLSKEIVNHIYRKLLINAVINPLTAIWRIPNGDLLATSKRVDMMKNLFTEGTAVYDACGVRWDHDLWDQIISVCENTAPNTSSMLKDVREGNLTEVQWINGSIVKLAQSRGLNANYHKMLVQLIEGIEVKEG